MRYNPFLGQYAQKYQKVRRQKERSMEGDKYDWEWMMTLQGTPQYYPNPEGDQITRKK
jgi:hypothetical protein